MSKVRFSEMTHSASNGEVPHVDIYVDDSFVGQIFKDEPSDKQWQVSFIDSPITGQGSFQSLMENDGVTLNIAAIKFDVCQYLVPMWIENCRLSYNNPNPPAKQEHELPYNPPEYKTEEFD